MKLHLVELTVCGIYASTGPMMFEPAVKVRFTCTEIRRGEYVLLNVPGSESLRLMLGPKRASTKTFDDDEGVCNIKVAERMIVRRTTMIDNDEERK